MKFNVYSEVQSNSIVAVYYRSTTICGKDLAKIELTVHAKTQKGLHFLISALDVVSSNGVLSRLDSRVIEVKQTISHLISIPIYSVIYLASFKLAKTLQSDGSL